MFFIRTFFLIHKSLVLKSEINYYYYYYYYYYCQNKMTLASNDSICQKTIVPWLSTKGVFINYVTQPLMPFVLTPIAGICTSPLF